MSQRCGPWDGSPAAAAAGQRRHYLIKNLACNELAHVLASPAPRCPITGDDTLALSAPSALDDLTLDELLTLLQCSPTGIKSTLSSCPPAAPAPVNQFKAGPFSDEASTDSLSSGKEPVIPGAKDYQRGIVAAVKEKQSGIAAARGTRANPETLQTAAEDRMGGGGARSWSALAPAVDEVDEWIRWVVATLQDDGDDADETQRAAPWRTTPAAGVAASGAVPPQVCTTGPNGTKKSVALQGCSTGRRGNKDAPALHRNCILSEEGLHAAAMPAASIAPMRTARRFRDDMGGTFQQAQTLNVSPVPRVAKRKWGQGSHQAPWSTAQTYLDHCTTQLNRTGPMFKKPRSIHEGLSSMASFSLQPRTQTYPLSGSNCFDNEQPGCQPVSLPDAQGQHLLGRQTRTAVPLLKPVNPETALSKKVVATSSSWAAHVANVVGMTSKRTEAASPAFGRPAKSPRRMYAQPLGREPQQMQVLLLGGVLRL